MLYKKLFSKSKPERFSEIYGGFGGKVGYLVGKSSLDKREKKNEDKEKSLKKSRRLAGFIGGITEGTKDAVVIGGLGTTGAVVAGKVLDNAPGLRRKIGEKTIIIAGKETGKLIKDTSLLSRKGIEFSKSISKYTDKDIADNFIRNKIKEYLKENKYNDRKFEIELSKLKKKYSGKRLEKKIEKLKTKFSENNLNKEISKKKKLIKPLLRVVEKISYPIVSFAGKLASKNKDLQQRVGDRIVDVGKKVSKPTVIAASGVAMIHGIRKGRRGARFGLEYEFEKRRDKEEQKEFARRDYEGLTEEQAANLRLERKKIAEELFKERHEANTSLDKSLIRENNRHSKIVSSIQEDKKWAEDVIKKNGGWDSNYKFGATPDFKASNFEELSRNKEASKATSMLMDNGSLFQREKSEGGRNKEQINKIFKDRSTDYELSLKDASKAAQKAKENILQREKRSNKNQTVNSSISNEIKKDSSGNIKQWVQNNPKMMKGIKVGCIGTAAIGAGLLTYHHFKDKKRN